MVSQAAQAAYERQKAAAAAARTASASSAGVNLAKLLPHVERKVVAMKSDSRYFDEEDLAVIPKYEFKELTLGRVLGKGRFRTGSEMKAMQG